MSWSTFTDSSLKGKDGKDESYIAGVFQLDGKTLSVHPSTFAPTEAEVKFLIDVIDGRELEQLQTRGCMLSGMKFAFLRKDESMLCLQRKKMKESEELKEDNRWPLCAFKAKQCLLIRISKLGPVSGGENTEKTGCIGDYLNAN